ncbi:MAG TPA: hypothetical protein VHA35_22430 [Dongiaceae bacterium]|jgi:hypothetical protein|nr:hypothetical protein [Dongiaceae bacterium]
MSQHARPKPAPAPKKDIKSNQPVLTELSPEELSQVAGGQKVQLSDITITHKSDKATP